jgi:hypothetical protein
MARNELIQDADMSLKNKRILLGFHTEGVFRWAFLTP